MQWSSYYEEHFKNLLWGNSDVIINSTITTKKISVEKHGRTRQNVNSSCCVVAFGKYRFLYLLYVLH